MEPTMSTSVSRELATIDLTTTILTPDIALKCLIGDYNVIVPTPTAKPCNHLDEYLLKSTLNTRRSSTGDKNDSRRRSIIRQPHEPFSVPLVRNFEAILKNPNSSVRSPFTEAICSRRAKPDVFTRFDQVNSGPISHLKNRVNQFIKVTIRRRRKVPYISRTIEYRGKLIMFDKHMNLYLNDVIESFNFKNDGKVFKRARHRDALVLRGDNIIMVA